jgi:7-cyano-7-deazaguanine synthase
MKKDKVLSLHSGGMDSLAVTLDMMERFKAKNIITLGINYGQRHFKMENEAAVNFCERYKLPRIIIDVPINQINKGRSLTDLSVPVTEKMEEQRTTVVNFRNSIFFLFAAGVALQNDCNYIAAGPNILDLAQYRDCRPIFYKYLQTVIQAGLTQPIKGSENIEVDLLHDGSLPDSKIDIKILLPLINETKIETVNRIINKYGVDIYKYSWSCYNGGIGKYNGLQCGKCNACVERKEAFLKNDVIDPTGYYAN